MSRFFKPEKTDSYSTDNADKAGDMGTANDFRSINLQHNIQEYRKTRSMQPIKKISERSITKGNLGAI